MPFLAKGITIYKSRNRFKTYFFKTKEKAQRFWAQCKRKGYDAQLIY